MRYVYFCNTKQFSIESVIFLILTNTYYFYPLQFCKFMAICQMIWDRKNFYLCSSNPCFGSAVWLGMKRSLPGRDPYSVLNRVHSEFKLEVKIIIVYQRLSSLEQILSNALLFEDIYTLIGKGLAASSLSPSLKLHWKLSKFSFFNQFGQVWKIGHFEWK